MPHRGASAGRSPVRSAEVLGAARCAGDQPCDHGAGRVLESGQPVEDLRSYTPSSTPAASHACSRTNRLSGLCRIDQPGSGRTTWCAAARASRSVSKGRCVAFPRGTQIAWLVGVSVARCGVASAVAGRFRLRPRPASGHAEGPRGENATRVRVSKRSRKRSTGPHKRPRIGHASPAKHDKTGTLRASNVCSNYAG